MNGIGLVNKIEYSRFGEKTTVCFLKLHNGFEIIGTSSCIDPNMFNEELGKKYAFKNAMSKVEESIAYHLQQQLYNSNTSITERLKENK